MVVTSIEPLLDSEFISLPLLLQPVPAGFPSPADDYLEGSIDFQKHLVKHPAATFAVRAQGDSMQGAGIFSGDILVVDRAEDPCDGAIVIAVVDGDFTVKRLRHIKGQVFLCPENSSYQPIPVTNSDDQIWGVVIYSIRKHQPR